MLKMSGTRIQPEFFERFFDLIPELALIFRTTLHATPVAGSYASTETPFTPATLSAGELASITGRCASIIGNASAFGICTSCRAGGLGGSKL
jgi:hypothetical protein